MQGSLPNCKLFACECMCMLVCIHVWRIDESVPSYVLSAYVHVYLQVHFFIFSVPGCLHACSVLSGSVVTKISLF
jgi:hypothetical protein